MSQAITQIQNQAVEAWANQNQVLAARGIDEPTWNALCSTIYPSSKPESIILAVDYCRSRNLDIMLKPVHLVPMNVKNPQTGNYEWRDVPMPGVGLYRIQAERTGNYVGADAPEFGPMITREFTTKSGGKLEFTFPEWCKYTVYKLAPNGERVAYTAMEFWEENYATDSGKSNAPNAMWQKRPRAQLAKCAEAQALRKGWPEIGQEPTAEEMEGKQYMKEINEAPEYSKPETPETYPDDKFQENKQAWIDLIKSGKKTLDALVKTVSTKGKLTEKQLNELKEAIGE